ncbi:caspase family protein, partial [Rhodoplanes serenus]|uniref:caspase family protein n=1 Tax=Rhodoplanes serenus TaxID=200615 RepID=UPI000DBBB66F
MRRLLTAFAVILGASVALGSAAAEPRMALVIGNSAYQTVTELPNPANDAKAVAELLAAAGFEVTTAPDLGQAEMRRAIGDFSARVAEKGADTVALVFYAGHGLQVDGENFLVPVDARITRESDVPLQTVRLADVMNALAAVPSRTRIVILDACRNNPFSEINKVVGRGLAIVDAPSGSIVSYSTAPGSEAEDGEGTNSPYTQALLGVAREPGMPIEQAFKRVRYAVHQATSGRQTPWESSSLTADFVFFPGASAATTPSVAATPAGVPVRMMSPGA